MVTASITAAIETFGDLHILVNNAGIIRDRVLVNMTEEEWDVVVHANVNGHFVPTRWAATYWREQSKAGDRVSAAVVNTSSTSGLLGNPGQSNYGTAKAGIAAFTVIAAQELSRYGVRVNAIVPGGEVAHHRVDPRACPTSCSRRPTPTCSTPGTPPTSPRSSPTSQASPAPSRGRSSSSRAASCSISNPGPRGADRQGGRWTIEELAAEMPKIVGNLAAPTGAPQTR